MASQDELNTLLSAADLAGLGMERSPHLMDGEGFRSHDDMGRTYSSFSMLGEVTKANINELLPEKNAKSAKQPHSKGGPWERLHTGWRVVKHSKFGFSRPRTLILDPDNNTLRIRKFEEGKADSMPDGELLMKQITRIVKGRHSSLLGKIRGFEDKCYITIHVLNQSSVFEFELKSEEERDLLHAALQHFLQST